MAKEKTLRDPGQPVVWRHEFFAFAIRSGVPCQKAIEMAGLELDSLAGKYYVYLLVDPRDDSIFYVGKGKAERAWQHVKNAKRGSIDNGAKHRMIREILEAGETVGVVILYRTDNETQAYKAERYLIRSIAKCGLSNISNGMRSSAETTLEEALTLRAGVAPLEWMLNGMSEDRKETLVALYGSVENYHTWIHATIDDIIASAKRDLETA